MFDFKNFVAQFKKTVKELSALARVIYIVLQIFFIVLYTYDIFANVGNIPKLVLYSFLDAILIAYFIFSLATEKKQKEDPKLKNIKNKVIKNIFVIGKFSINGACLLLSAISIVQDGASDLQLILTLVAFIMWLVNIIIEVVKTLVVHYGSLLIASFKMDCEKNIVGGMLDQYNIKVRDFIPLDDEEVLRARIKEDTKIYGSEGKDDDSSSSSSSPNFIQALFGAVKYANYGKAKDRTPAEKKRLTNLFNFNNAFSRGPAGKEKSVEKVIAKASSAIAKFTDFEFGNEFEILSTLLREALKDDDKQLKKKRVYAYTALDLVSKAKDGEEAIILMEFALENIDKASREKITALVESR